MADVPSRPTCLLILLMVMCMVVAASSVNLVTCTPQYCTTVKCQEVRPETCSGKVLPKSSICGCCDACIAIIEKGGWCMESTPAPGYTNFQKCAEGTQCIGAVCTEIPEPQS